MFVWVLAFAAAEISAAPSKSHLPAKLLAAKHRFELARDADMRDVAQADEKMEKIGDQVSASEDRFEAHEEQLREHAEEKMEKQDDAFEAAMKKTEDANHKDAEEMMKKYEDHMRGFESKLHSSSLLETSDKDALEAATSQVLAEAREAAHAKLGDGIRDLMREQKEGRAAQTKRLEGARQEEVEKLDGLRAGMKREESKLEEFSKKLRGEHRFVDRTMDAERDAYDSKLQQTEDRIEAQDKARQAKFQARERAETKAFKQKDVERREMIEDAFHIPRGTAD